jgi:hypothetical protein
VGDAALAIEVGGGAYGAKPVHLRTPGAHEGFAIGASPLEHGEERPSHGIAEAAHERHEIEAGLPIAILDVQQIVANQGLRLFAPGPLPRLRRLRRALDEDHVPPSCPLSG